jgi:hypothetical protein
MFGFLKRFYHLLTKGKTSVEKSIVDPPSPIQTKERIQYGFCTLPTRPTFDNFFVFKRSSTVEPNNHLVGWWLCENLSNSDWLIEAVVFDRRNPAMVISFREESMAMAFKIMFSNLIQADEI